MADPRPGSTATAGMPLWVKVAGILILIGVVIAVVMLPGILGMGGHGPQLH